MLWLNRVPDETELDATKIEDFVIECFGAMQQIAKTIYSPVGFLDPKIGLALGYDIETMDTDSQGSSH